MNGLTIFGLLAVTAQEPWGSCLAARTRRTTLRQSEQDSVT
jgi:hypothetical protein